MLAIFADIGVLSYGIYVGDESTSLLYPIYLWVIFGNGFRFGLKYLFIATAVSVAGFSVVVATAEYWRAHLHLAGGLLAGLIVLPLYAATLIRKLSAARQQAEEASQAKSRFLTSVSHELRTPLNAIIGLSELMRSTPLDSEQQEMTQTIGTAGRSLLGADQPDPRSRPHRGTPHPDDPRSSSTSTPCWRMSAPSCRCRRTPSRFASPCM